MICSIQRNAAVLASTLYLALFLSGFLSFAGTWTHGKVAFLSVLIYIIYCLGLALMVSVLVWGTQRRQVLFKVLFFCILFVSPVLLGDRSLDSVERSYLVGICSIFVFTSVSVAGDGRVVGRFAASLVALGSLFCLLDACFLDGFTNTTGRAAALFVNPNVAALTLLIGATGSIWAVPPQWRLAFLIVVGGGVLSTMSRSAILVGMLALLAALPLYMNRSRRVALLNGSGRVRAALALLAVFVLLTSAVVNNKAVTVAAKDAFRGLLVANAVWAESPFGRSLAWSPSTEEVSTAKREMRSGLEEDAGGQQAALDAASVISSSGVNSENQKAQQIVAGIEQENSAAARAALMQRAFEEYRFGPSAGLGLKRAFELAPHNSYLFFAVAFGHFGWLIVPIFILLIFWLAGLQRGFPLAVLISGASFFSHDIFVALPLIAALVVLVSGLVSVKLTMADQSDPVERSAALVAVLVAVSSLLVVKGVGDMVSPYRTTIAAESVNHLGGAAYYASLTPPNPQGIMRIARLNEPTSLPRMHEAGEVIGRCDSSIEKVISEGGGRCNYDSLNVVFSTSDNSSPLENGRAYAFSAAVSIHPLLIAMVLAVQLWAILWCFVAFRRRVT